MSTTTLIEPGHVAIGLIVRFATDGTPLVAMTGGGRPRRVEATAGISVAALRLASTTKVPVIIGNLDERLVVLGFLTQAPVQLVEAEDPHRTISASESLTLSCGKASITLTKAGKVLIEGEYLGTRTRGATRVRGGSVQIN